MSCNWKAPWGLLKLRRLYAHALENLKLILWTACWIDNFWGGGGMKRENKECRHERSRLTAREGFCVKDLEEMIENACKRRMLVASTKFVWLFMLAKSKKIQEKDAHLQVRFPQLQRHRFILSAVLIWEVFHVQMLDSNFHLLYNCKDSKMWILLSYLVQLF